MAERILGAYSSSRGWPREFTALLTPQKACAMLARDATLGLICPRPALVASLADVAGNEQLDEAPAIVLAASMKALVLKLNKEARADMYTALVRMPPDLRGWLLKLADPSAELSGRDDAALICADDVRAFAERLSEGPPVDSAPATAHEIRPRLLPPYSLLLLDLVTPDGSLSITYSEGRLSFAPEVRLILAPQPASRRTRDGRSRHPFSSPLRATAWATPSASTLQCARRGR